MDLEQELSMLQEEDEVKDARIKQGNILVTFNSSVDSYLDGVGILKEGSVVTDEKVKFYSNMSDREQISILLEYE